MALSTLRLISPVIGDHSHQPSEFKFPKREFCLQTKVKCLSQGSWLKPAMGSAETGSETTSEELKIQNCSRGAYPKTPQVSACFARTLYTFIFQDVANGLSTFYLLPTGLYNYCDSVQTMGQYSTHLKWFTD